MTSHDNRVTGRADEAGGGAWAAPGQPIRQLRGMFGALDRLGYDIEALVAPSGLRLSDIEDPDQRISSRVCNDIFRRAWQERRITNLSLRIAMETPIGANPLLDYMIASADSVGDGLHRLGRYLGLVHAGTRIVVREQDDPVRVLIEASGGAASDCEDPFRIEFAVSHSVLRFLREADGDFRVTAVCFTHEPDDVAEFADVLRCPVHTRAAWNGWTTTKASLQLPMRRRDPMLSRWLEQRAVRLLVQEPSSDTVGFEVRQWLSTRVAGGDTRIDLVARQLGITPRTLQRRLAAEGTTYDVLRDNARKQAAETFLADSALSIAEIAYLLGYAEPTAFHRAFRRWHRMTPQRFRDRRRSVA